MVERYIITDGLRQIGKFRTSQTPSPRVKTPELWRDLGWQSSQPSLSLHTFLFPNTLTGIVWFGSYIHYLAFLITR